MRGNGFKLKEGRLKLNIGKGSFAVGVENTWKIEAGRLLPSGDRAASCLTEVLPRPVTPAAVRKFRNTTNPAPGVERVFYGRADDPDVASHLTHGIPSPLSLSVASLINPLPKTAFQQMIQDKKEAIYFSNRQGSLGRSHDQSPMLPKGLDVINTTFGIKVIRDVSAGELINPPKTFEEVDKEAREGHDLYIVSHNDYYVGEAINRKYDSPSFSKSFAYGIKTPHFKDGRGVSKALNWPPDLQVVAETMNVPPERAFGAVLCPDKIGVGDLLQCWVPCEILRGKGRGIAVLAAVRQSLKKDNYERFDMLLEAFRHYDKNGSGMIDKNNLLKCCFQLNVNLDHELLDSLFDCCDLDKDGLINYLDFINYLNWKDKMAVKEFEAKIIAKEKELGALVPEDVNDKSQLKEEHLALRELGSSEEAPETLRSTEGVLANYQTTSSQYNAVVGGLPTLCYPVCGVPSVRLDLPAPRIRCVSDRTNYGDQGNAYSLLFPSVFSQKGVHEGDLFKARPKAEIAEILHNIGVNVSDERLEEIWKQTCMKHQKEEVSVESIRNVLDEIHGSHTKPTC
ncbi:EF-hand domain-containing family member B [Pogoniulus pusillus]|uniref:EF-hand domain-containing family member B n=1 Tax=Pogoniulus pusillus TaxID=488313 RepID=UPI0030B97C16